MVQKKKITELLLYIWQQKDAVVIPVFKLRNGA